MKTALYRHYDATGALLYVGITADPMGRFGAHSRNSGWFTRVARIEIMWFDDREAALLAERKAITDEKPPHCRDLSKSICDRSLWQEPLAGYLHATGLSQSGFASLVKVAPTQVSAYLLGKTQPRKATRERIERATEGAIPVASWPERTP